MLTPFHYDPFILISVIFPQMKQGAGGKCLPYFCFPLTLGRLTYLVFIFSHPDESHFSYK